MTLNYERRGPDAPKRLVIFLHGMRRGMSRVDAMTESLRINLAPVFLTSLTTAIGFMSLNFSDAPPFRDLGNMAAMGVSVAFLLTNHEIAFAILLAFVVVLWGALVLSRLRVALAQQRLRSPLVRLAPRRCRRHRRKLPRRPGRQAPERRLRP